MLFTFFLNVDISAGASPQRVGRSFVWDNSRTIAAVSASMMADSTGVKVVGFAAIYVVMSSLPMSDCGDTFNAAESLLIW